MFDPYHKWLGIAHDQQPPTLYQLLGISPTEQDPEVIEEAAIRQTAHVRTYQTGPHAKECVRLLNEIAEAQTTLLNPARRKAYDARLAGQGRKAPAVPVAPPVATPSAPDGAPEDVFAGLTAPDERVPGASPRRGAPAPPGRPVWPWVAGGGVAAAALVGGLIFYLTRPNNPGPVTKGPDPGVDAQSKPALLPGSPRFTVRPAEVRLAPGESQKLTIEIDRDGVSGKVLTLVDHQLKWLKAVRGGAAESSERPEWELTIAPDAQDGEGTVRVRAQVGSQGARGLDEVKIVVHKRLAGEKQFFHGHAQAVWAVALSADGKQALSAGEDRVVRVWEVATGKLTQVLKGHTERVEAATYSPAAGGGRFVLTGGADRTVRLWDLEAPQEPVHEFTGHTDTVTCLTFSADGRWAASGGLDKVVRVWDVVNRKPLQSSQPTSTQQISGVDFAPDGNTILYACNDRTLRLWDRASNQERELPTGHVGELRKARFLPDGRHVASGGMDGTVRVTEVATGQEVRVFPTDNHDRVWDVAPSPNGRYLLAAGQSGALYLWDVVEGRRVQLARDTARVLKVAYAADASSALSGNEAGMVRLWELPAPPAGPVVLLPEKPTQTAKQAVPQPAAQDEVRQALRQELAAEYKAAAQHLDRRRELVRKLFQRAQDSKANAAQYFVLLSETRDQAAACGDVKTAGEAIGQLIESYTVEAGLTEMWVKVLEAVGELKDFRGIQFRAAAEQALAVAEDAVQGDDYPGATQLLRLGEKVARLSGNKELLAALTGRAKAVEGLSKDYEQIKPAVETLRRDPADPNANSVVGKYRCLAKDDWERGLPLLARGSDVAWKKLAQQELAAPSTPPAQVALGHEWWSRAQQETEYPGAKGKIEERARRWYWRAFRNLPAAEKTKLLPRLTVTIDKLTYQPGLKAELFNFIDTGMGRVPKLAATRIDHEIAFNWGSGSPHTAVTAHNFGVVWKGFLIAPKAGDYTLILRADDCARLTLDNKPLVGHLNVGGSMEERIAVRLTTRPRPVMVEHRQGGGPSHMHLLWIPPGETQAQPVPTEALYHRP